jgi:hypothetical protein
MLFILHQEIKLVKENNFCHFQYLKIFIDIFLGFPAGILQTPFFNKDAPK